jgi:hypothetical protein
MLRKLLFVIVVVFLGGRGRDLQVMVTIGVVVVALTLQVRLSFIQHMHLFSHTIRPVSVILAVHVLFDASKQQAATHDTDAPQHCFSTACTTAAPALTVASYVHPTLPCMQSLTSNAMHIIKPQHLPHRSTLLALCP